LLLTLSLPPGATHRLFLGGGDGGGDGDGGGGGVFLVGVWNWGMDRRELEKASKQQQTIDTRNRHPSACARAPRRRRLGTRVGDFRGRRQAKHTSVRHRHTQAQAQQRTGRAGQASDSHRDHRKKKADCPTLQRISPLHLESARCALALTLPPRQHSAHRQHALHCPVRRGRPFCTLRSVAFTNSPSPFSQKPP